MVQKSGEKTTVGMKNNPVNNSMKYRAQLVSLPVEKSANLWTLRSIIFQGSAVSFWMFLGCFILTRAKAVLGWPGGGLEWDVAQIWPILAGSVFFGIPILCGLQFFLLGNYRLDLFFFLRLFFFPKFVWPENLFVFYWQKCIPFAAMGCRRHSEIHRVIDILRSLESGNWTQTKRARDFESFIWSHFFILIFTNHDWSQFISVYLSHS